MMILAIGFPLVSMQGASLDRFRYRAKIAIGARSGLEIEQTEFAQFWEMVANL
jgi:hypothetical protein